MDFLILVVRLCHVDYLLFSPHDFNLEMKNVSIQFFLPKQCVAKVSKFCVWHRRGVLAHSEATACPVRELSCGQKGLACIRAQRSMAASVPVCSATSRDPAQWEGKWLLGHLFEVIFHCSEFPGRLGGA